MSDAAGPGTPDDEPSLFDPVNRNRVRPSVKALIIRDDHLLVTVNSDRTGVFHLLPGGGQEFGESIVDALRRECREEICLEVRVGDLVAVRDYIGAHHEFATWDSHYHQIELIFEASVAPGAEPALGPGQRHVPDRRPLAAAGRVGRRTALPCGAQDLVATGRRPASGLPGRHQLSGRLSRSSRATRRSRGRTGARRGRCSARRG